MLLVAGQRVKMRQPFLKQHTTQKDKEVAVLPSAGVVYFPAKAIISACDF
jgi:hypothetical protein